ncbi:phage tail protein [Formicincola oecophyllae]|nr:phage tail protein [Formicincola oecophyllae]
MTNFITIKTKAGLALEAAADAKGGKITLTQLAVGDGAGADYTPTEDQTALKHETARVPLNALAVSADDPTEWKAEGIFGAGSGGYTIREAGLFTDDGTLFAIANLPEVYKPATSDGAVGQLALTLTFKTANASVINLVVDPNTAVATRTYVDEHVQAEARRAEGAEATFVSGTAGLVPANGDGQGLGLHTNGGTKRPMYGDASGWRDLALAADLAGYQPKGAYVPNQPVKDQYNKPITLLAVNDTTQQAWFMADGQGPTPLVGGRGADQDGQVKAAVTQGGDANAPAFITTSGDYVPLSTKADVGQMVSGVAHKGTLDQAVISLFFQTSTGNPCLTYNDVGGTLRFIDLTSIDRLYEETQERQQADANLQTQINNLPKLISQTGNNTWQEWQASGVSDKFEIKFPTPFKNSDPSQINIQITGQDSNPQSLYANFTAGSVTNEGFQIRVININSGQFPVHDAAQGTFNFIAVGKT